MMLLIVREKTRVQKSDHIVNLFSWSEQRALTYYRHIFCVITMT